MPIKSLSIAMQLLCFHSKMVAVPSSANFIIISSKSHSYRYGKKIYKLKIPQKIKNKYFVFFKASSYDWIIPSITALLKIRFMVSTSSLIDCTVLDELGR